MHRIKGVIIKIDPSSRNFTKGQQQKFMNDKKQKKNKGYNKLQ
jgi:hypothetical protein